MILTEKNTVTFLKSDTGEALIPVSVSNSYDLVRKFGIPKSTNYNEWFQIYNYLKYYSPINVIRPLSVLSESKRMNIYSNLVPVFDTILNFYNSTVADLDNITTDDDMVLSVVEKYCNSNEDISVVIVSNLTAWKNSITNEYIDIVLSRSVTDPSTLTPEDQDTYIVATGAIGAWVGQETKIAIYDTDTSSWNFVSTSEGGSYYISDEEIEIYKSGAVFVERTTLMDYIEFDDHTLIRKAYTTIQDMYGEIKKCYQLVNITPDFDNGEFAIFVFKKNSTYLTFDLVEKFILSTDEDADNYYTTLESNYIYLQYFQGACNTTNFSVMENTIQFQSESVDYSVVSASDYTSSIDITYDDYDMVLNVEIDSKQDLIPTLCETSSCLCLTGAWSTYDTITDLINDFGIYSDSSTGYTVFNRNNTMIGNCKKMYDGYNDKFRYVSMVGDVAGLLFSDKSLIKETTDTFPLIGFTDLVLLKENKINIVDSDINLKQFFTSELYKAKFKYTNNSLIHNIITKNILEIINNIEGLSKPPIQRVMDRIEQHITPYMKTLTGIDIDSYTLTIEQGENNTLNIVLTITYFGVIEQITVNFLGDFANESFTMNYKN